MGESILKPLFFIVIPSFVITGSLLILIYLHGLEFKYISFNSLILHSVYLFSRHAREIRVSYYIWWAIPYISVQPSVELKVSTLCEVETLFHFCYKGMEWCLHCSNSFKVSNCLRCMRSVKPVLKVSSYKYLNWLEFGLLHSNLIRKVHRSHYSLRSAWNRVHVQYYR